MYIDNVVCTEYSNDKFMKDIVLSLPQYLNYPSGEEEIIFYFYMIFCVYMEKNISWSIDRIKNLNDTF